MAVARVGMVALLAFAILGAAGAFSFRDVSATGRAGVAKVPALFKDHGNKGGNGNGNGNGQGNGNGNAGQGHDSDAGQAKGNKKHKKDKSEKKSEKGKKDSAKGTDQANDNSGKNPKSGNVDCDDVAGMIEYLTSRNMNGAIHANENGADNAALGALNKCNAPGQQDDDEAEAETDGTPTADEGTPEVETDDATPDARDGTPSADDEDGTDQAVSVEVNIDEDGNGEIRYDLDGDGETDLTMIIEDGKVVEYVEAGADDATPDIESGE